MANGLYDSGREGFLDGSIDWDTNAQHVILTDSADYTVDLATHSTLGSVASAARVAVSAAMSSKTVTAGVADAADVTWSSVTGDQSELVVGSQGTVDGSRLIFCLDTFASGMPVTPNGGDIVCQWDSGANKIFKL